MSREIPNYRPKSTGWAVSLGRLREPPAEPKLAVEKLEHDVVGEDDEQPSSS